jgi:predicted metal-dependent peptidase
MYRRLPLEPERSRLCGNLDDYPDLKQQFSASLLHLRMKGPFFETLPLFMGFVPNRCISTTATDGHDFEFNPNYISTLSAAQLDGALFHQSLHTALLHPSGAKGKDVAQWNTTAEIIVNGILAQYGLNFPLQ